MSVHIDSHEYDSVSLLPPALADRLYAGARILQKDVASIEWTALARAATHFPQLVPFLGGGAALPIDTFFEKEQESSAIAQESSAIAPASSAIALFPHQLKSLSFMKTAEETAQYGIRGGILNVGMGLGKTLTALAHICRFPTVSNLKGKGTLIVCSKTLLPEWKSAGVEKFFSNDYAPSVLYFHSMFMKRKEYLATTAKQFEKYDIVITTYECVNASFKGSVSSKALHSKRWARVIWDESHKLSAVSSMGYRTSKALKYDAGWCLTGTMFRNGYTDLWSQFSLCGYFGCPQKQWKSSIFRCMRDHRLKDRILTISKPAGFDIPDKTETTVNTQLKGRPLQLFNIIKDRVRDANARHDIDNRTFTDVLALLTALRQICIAPYLAKHKLEAILSPEMLEWVQNKEGDAGYKAPKVQVAVDLVKKAIAKGEQVLIFSTLSSAVELVVDAVNHSVPKAKACALTGKITGNKRTDLIDSFRSRKSKVMGLSYRLGSEGLNLTEATTVICIDQWWNSATHRQAKARSWRIGQDKQVVMYDVIVPNGVDPLCINVCKIKDREEESIEKGVSLTGVIKICLGEFLRS